MPGAPRPVLDRVVLDDVVGELDREARPAKAVRCWFISAMPPVPDSRWVKTPVMWPGIPPVWPT